MGKRILLILLLMICMELKVTAKESYYTIVCEATGYTHTGNNTATGVYPYYGTIAVDPSIIPLYSNLHVEGYGKGKALDTGGVIVGYKIDVFFDTYEEAILWGRKKVKVKVFYN